MFKLALVALVAGGGVVAAVMTFLMWNGSQLGWSESGRDIGLVVAGAGLCLGRLFGVRELSRREFRFRKSHSVIMGIIVCVLLGWFVFRLYGSYYSPMTATIEELQSE